MTEYTATVDDGYGRPTFVSWSDGGDTVATCTEELNDEVR